MPARTVSESCIACSRVLRPVVNPLGFRVSGVQDGGGLHGQAAPPLPHPPRHLLRLDLPGLGPHPALEGTAEDLVRAMDVATEFSSGNMMCPVH